VRTKRFLALVISLLSVPALFGLTMPTIGSQEPGKVVDQDKTKTSSQDKAKAAGQQNTVPPARQKTKPLEMQKNKVKEATLSSYYKHWLDEDVLYIITPEERSTFKALTTDEERENFIEQFWARRNPDPREPGNQFKIEHYRRIVYANERFASGIPGWKTDRGLIYILYGEPDGKESHPSGGSYQREIYEGGGQTSVYPFERWRYRHIDGVGDDVELEFVDKTMTGEYRLAMSSEEKDALLMVPNAGLTTNEENGTSDKADRVNYGGMSQTDYQRSKDAPFERLARYFNVQRPPQIKFADLKGVVTTRVTYSQLPYAMRTDFIRLSPARVLVPITIELNNGSLEFKKEMQFNRAQVNVYGQITNLRGMIAAEFENTISAEYTDELFEAGKRKRSIYQKIVLLEAGQRYRLDLILKDLNSNYVGSMSYGLFVPRFDSEDLLASSVILANYVTSIPPTYEQLEQFVIGDMKVQPNVKSEYTSGQVLMPYLQVYNTAYDQTTLEPSLQISYLIKSGDKVVQDIEDAKGKTVQFTSGQRVVIVAQIPVQNLSPGNYSLEIKVLDRIANKSLVTNADFHVIK
jgi:GWxTD domain-containing protein